MEYSHPNPPFSFMLCASTILPSQSVLTSRYTHPLPQYGDTQIGHGEAIQAHFSRKTYINMQRPTIYQTALKPATHPLCISEIKRLCHCWEREVVYRQSKMLWNSPPKQNRVWGGKYKVKFTQTLAQVLSCSCQSPSIMWVSLLVSAPMIISKERQPDKRAEQKEKMASEWAGRSSPTAHPKAVSCCTSKAVTSCVS